MFEMLGELVQWFYSGIYDFVTATIAYIIEWLVVGMLTMKIFFIQFSWDIASNIMANLGLSQALSDAFSSLDSTLLGYVTFFRLPEAITIIIQAHVTKFTMGFLGQ